MSKTWLQVWSNLPNLDFTIDYLKDNDMKIVDDIMRRYWDGKIPIQKFELSVETFIEDSHEVLLVPMIDKWLGVVLRNGVKHLTMSSYPLFIFSILAVNSVRKLVLEYCTLLPSVVVVNCNSLRKLSLSYLTCDENMLQT